MLTIETASERVAHAVFVHHLEQFRVLERTRQQRRRGGQHGALMVSDSLVGNSEARQRVAFLPSSENRRRLEQRPDRRRLPRAPVWPPVRTRSAIGRPLPPKGATPRCSAPSPMLPVLRRGLAGDCEQQCRSRRDRATLAESLSERDQPLHTFGSELERWPPMRVPGRASGVVSAPDGTSELRRG